MATGRRDYTGGYLVETAAGARYTSCFIDRFGVYCDPGELYVLYSYEVPAGYRLGLHHVYISSDGIGPCPVTIEVDEELKLLFMLNESYDIEIPAHSPYYIKAGETLTIGVTNGDEVTVLVIGNVLGVLEEVN